MRSFLGVPIVSAGDIIGAFYLTDKRGEPEFSAADESAVVLLASHAAIAIDQARLFEDSRELGLVQERGRLARELHDAMSQSLFSLQLSAETAGRLLESDPAGAAEQVATVRALARRVAAELRTTVDGLRPADLERDGLVAALGAQLTLAGRAHDVAVEIETGELPELDPDDEHQILRIAQEAVTNALRHADASRVRVSIGTEGGRDSSGWPPRPAGDRRWPRFRSDRSGHAGAPIGAHVDARAGRLRGWIAHDHVGAGSGHHGRAAGASVGPGGRAP